MSIQKIIGIEGSNISWTCKQICNMIDSNKISFDNIIQRSFVWENMRSSELIWSIITGYPIPPVYAKKGVSQESQLVNVYDILDGQQRFTSIYRFRNNLFQLSKLKPISYLDENNEIKQIDISNMLYEELPEELRDIIDGKTITIYFYDSLNQIQQAEMFRRLNNGKQLSSKSRTLASCQDIVGLLEIADNKLFDKENGMLTTKGLKNKNQVPIVMKSWCMLNKNIGDISFEAKKFNPLLENTIVTEEQKTELTDVFNYAVCVHDELFDKKLKRIAKKIFTETHLVSLVPFFRIAIEKDIDANTFIDSVVKELFDEDGKPKSKEYDDAVNNSSAKPTSIRARFNEIKKIFDSAFSEDIKNAFNERFIDNANKENVE